MILNDWMDLRWASEFSVFRAHLREMERYVRREYDPTNEEWQYATDMLSGAYYASAGSALVRHEKSHLMIHKIFWRISVFQRLMSAAKTSDLLWDNVTRGNMNVSACDTRQRICRAVANYPWSSKRRLEQAEEAIYDGLCIIRYLSSPVCYTHVFFLIARADIFLRVMGDSPVSIKAIHEATQMAHEAEILTGGSDARSSNRLRRHARAFRHLGILYARADRAREASDCLERALLFDETAEHMHHSE